MTERERLAEELVRSRVRPAIIDETMKWSGHTGTVWHVERYIWRTEDVPLYRVAVGEALNTPLLQDRPHTTLETRMLEYVPTGRIQYDNSSPPAKAVLFEYRLKQARGFNDRRKTFHSFRKNVTRGRPRTVLDRIASRLALSAQ